ncbi:MAG: glycosyltransferase family 2 protein [Eubacteriales bacterium]|nr:glycosyltransferase family 2 protein [Eubacteriales bacterium]
MDRKKQDICISVVIPMYYEQEVAQECHRRLTAVMQQFASYELLYVNDGSLDDTLPILRDIAAGDAHVKVLSFSRNFGHQAAVSAGLAYAGGDVVVIIDADLQDPPELIPDMVRMWREGNDVVYAQRQKRQGETFFKLFTAKMFYRFLRSMTDIDIPPDTGDFRLMDRAVVNAFLQLPERNRFIRGMVPWLGFTAAPLPYRRDERFAGITKYPLKKMLKFATDGIISFSIKPLQLSLSLGVAAVVMALGFILYALISWMLGKAVPGWTPIMMAVAFFGGVQLISIGVLGMYVGRIYEESRARPLYIVKETINFPADAPSP